jgi:transposase-like protein
VRWYIAYALSLRNLEEMMEERGVVVDQLAVSRPVRTAASRRRRRAESLRPIAVERKTRLDELAPLTR